MSMFSLATVQGQEVAERSLRQQIARVKADAASEGLEVERIISALRDALQEEQRLLSEQRANERSY